MKPGTSMGFAINRLEDELSELFGRRVDLVSKRSLHPLLRERVLADASRTRNRIVDGYWSVDFEVLMAIARDDLPGFLAGIRSLAAATDGGD